MTENRIGKIEFVLILAVLAITFTSLYYFGSSITGFVIKESSYADNVGLVVTANGSSSLKLDDFGELKSLKIDGRITNYGKAKVYLENNGIKYLIFDSERLNESNENLGNKSGNLITGFATSDKKENKKDSNIKPKWIGTDEFIVNGTLSINLSQQFFDADNDTLTYAVSETDGISISLDDGIATLTAKADKNFNTTMTFTASDGIKSTSHVVELIAIIVKIKENKAPLWHSPIDAFIINGTTTLNLSEYFADEDNDALIYNFANVDGIVIKVDKDLMTLIPNEDYSGNASTLFTAFDGIELATKSVKLVVNVKIINFTLPNNESTNATFPVNETINATLPINETINVTKPVNETNENISRVVSLKLGYKSGSVYDANDDGQESINGVVDLTVEGTGFNWEADESRLCTRWEVYNAEDKKSTTFCDGNKDCCAFVDLLPTKSNWSEIYYSTFGKDNAGHDNIVSAQVIYYDVNLSPDSLKSEIYYSEWQNLSVKFFEEETEFFDACLETCSLKGLNKSSYNLIFEVEDGALLRIDKVKYSVLTDVYNNAPVLLQNFSTINISKDKNVTINLSQYFSDPDGNVLTYSYFKADNITILFDNDIATIVPDKGFDGIRFIYFAANDSENIAVSNVFMINVSGEAYKPRVEIGKPVRWINTYVVDTANISSFNLTLPENAFNVSVSVVNQTALQGLSDEKLKVIENNKIKNKNLFEIEKKMGNINKKISILEEAGTKAALKVAVDEREYNGYEIDSKLKELYSRKSELGNELNQLSSLDDNLLSANVFSPAALNETQPILLINENLTRNFKIQVEYETEAPIAVENEVNSFTKQIKVISETNYENVLAYTSINDVPKESIKLYWIQNDSKILFDNIDYFDDNNNSLIDRIEWIIPHLSNQTFEVSITILNVQSYPTVGGNWVVSFNATGTANLSISASNGTRWSNSDENYDLKLLSIKCGNDILGYTWVDNGDNSTVLIEDYSCNETGYETSKVLTSGKHHLMFRFGNLTAYAHNLATAGLIVDDTDSDFGAGTLIKTNISNAVDGGANVTLNFTTHVLKGDAGSGNMSSGQKVYNTTGNFTSKAFDTTSSASLFDQIIWTANLPNISDAMGYMHSDNDDDTSVLYSDGSTGVDGSSADFDLAIGFNGELNTYTIPAGFSRDDIVGAGYDYVVSDAFLFFRNGSIAIDNGLTALSAQNPDFTAGGISKYTIPVNFNTSDIIASLYDTASDDAVLFFKNGSYVTAAASAPPFAFSAVLKFTLPSGWSTDNVIGAAYDETNNHAALFFRNTSHLIDTTVTDFTSQVDFAASYDDTYNSGYNLSQKGNITMYTRVRNSSTWSSWTNYNYGQSVGSFIVENRTINLSQNVGRYIEYKAAFRTYDKYFTPILENVTMNYTLGLVEPPSATIGINNTQRDIWHRINISGNLTDESLLNTTWVTNNVSNSNSTLTSVGGTFTEYSALFYIDDCGMYNFTVYVNDTDGHLAQNSTLYNNTDCQIRTDFSSDGNITLVSSGAGTAWTNPKNANITDDVYATSVLLLGASTTLLNMTNLSYAIPRTNAIISGIKCLVEHKTSVSSSMADTTIQLFQDYALVGSSKANVITWSTADENFTYGYYTDLWGTTFTPTQVDNLGFGLAMSATDSGFAATASIDVLKCGVFYNLTVSVADTCSPSCPLSADYGFNCADNCVITSNCDANGKNVYVYGSGTMTVNALIYNFKQFAVHGGCNFACIRQNGCFG